MDDGIGGLLHRIAWRAGVSLLVFLERQVWINVARYNVAMAEANDDTGATCARLEQIFEAIAKAMESAASKADHSVASSVAEGLGLKEVLYKSTGAAWEATESGLTLRFQWHYFDQSHSFRVQKDMNILSLELREGDKTIRKSEERFED
jgi:hypothetical protein